MKTETIQRLLAAVAVPVAMVMTCSCQERLADDAGVAPSNKEAEIGKWEADGWRYQETVGEEIPEATSGVHLESDSARVIGAVARRADGELIEKGFPQEDTLYLVVTMSGGERGTYCLVFSKPKPPNKSE